MDCVEVFGGQIHPFMDSVDAEEMQPVWKGQEDNESMREIETVVEVIYKIERIYNIFYLRTHQEGVL